MRLFLLLSSLLCASVAHADDVGAAKTHYQDGTKRYNLGDYEQALTEFKAAYLAKSDPAFLFNIGQCQRQLGLWDAAEKSYRGYLRESPSLPAKNREEVKKLIAEMETAVKENRAKQPPQGTLPPEQTPAAAPVVTPAPVAATTPEPAKREPVRTPVYKKWWLWTIVGVVIAAGVGVGLGVGLTQSSSVSYPSATTTAGTVRF
jgi:tetratricopeptide (TPR) repeat protein